MRKINVPPLEHKQVHALIYDIMNDKQRKDYDEFLGVRLFVRDSQAGALSRECLQSGPGCSRCVPHHSNPDQDPGRAELPGGVSRPDQMAGLILVTGPTGSGKSTTLAAMIDHINKANTAIS